MFSASQEKGSAPKGAALLLKILLAIRRLLNLVVLEWAR